MLGRAQYGFVLFELLMSSRPDAMPLSTDMLDHSLGIVKTAWLEFRLWDTAQFSVGVKREAGLAAVAPLAVEVICRARAKSARGRRPLLPARGDDQVLDAPTAVDEDEPSRSRVQTIDEQRGVVERADEVERQLRRLSRTTRIYNPLRSQAAAAEPWTIPSGSPTLKRA